MCGFAGIISWSDRHRVHRAVLERMSAKIAHRGPDGQGLYLNHEQEISPTRPQVGLVHRRLAIIDLDPRANQPFADPQGRQLVFNGEIYNYRELRKELEPLLPHYPWRTQSDTEVLLAAYAAWGEKCVEHLNGMFAFAIWDEPNGELFLARDRMGQKPLYVAYVDESQSLSSPFQQWSDGNPPTDAVAFASELNAFDGIPWVDRRLCGRALQEYLQWGCTRGTEPIYEGIRQIEQGHWLRLKRLISRPRVES